MMRCRGAEWREGTAHRILSSFIPLRTNEYSVLTGPYGSVCDSRLMSSISSRPNVHDRAPVDSIVTASYIRRTSSRRSLLDLNRSCVKV